MNELIARLKLCMFDECLQLDRDQTMYLMFLLYTIADSGPQIQASDLKYSVLDLLGALPSEEAEGVGA